MECRKIASRFSTSSGTPPLAEERNYQGLVRLNTELVQHERVRRSTERVTVDVDSSESPVHGAQERSAYNGHFESVCYHPLFVFSPEGRLPRGQTPTRQRPQ